MTIKEKYKVKGDKVVWIIYILFMLISLIEVFSSMGKTVYDKEGGDIARMFVKHITILITGLGICYIAHLIKYQQYAKIITIGFWISIGLLVLTFLLGRMMGKAAGRWLVLPIIGQFQPSEIVKYIIVIYTARGLSLYQDNIKDKNIFFKILWPIVIICGLIFPENFSTAGLVFLVCYILMYIGRVNLKYYSMILLGVLGAIFVMFMIFKYDSSLLERSSTWQNRIESYKNNDKTEINQTNLALMAISTGGVSGKFIGNTEQARFLSESHNDFIFAIILEEGGLWLGILIMILYLILIYRTIRIARNAKGLFGSLVAVGIALVFTMQAIVNMMVATNLIPVTGQTLPFISYGGTSFVFSSFALGIILNISSAENQKTKQEILEEIEQEKQEEIEQEDNRVEEDNEVEQENQEED
ncbi:MAG: FtsW/RodA/SpoVE family cell cycle protein [Bacteroidales bacterium]|jgi:cell division protein FtsW|nr:FtsW/RodA/SpoVE family cell cycle protein [Bacteroidales bacterium]